MTWQQRRQERRQQRRQERRERRAWRDAIYSGVYVNPDPPPPPDWTPPPIDIPGPSALHDIERQLRERIADEIAAEIHDEHLLDEHHCRHCRGLRLAASIARGEDHGQNFRQTDE